jgi:hypothetical protein
MYAAAYNDAHPPCALPEADINEIKFIDHLMTCRGGGSGVMDLAMQPLQPAMDQQMQSMAMLMNNMFAGMRVAQQHPGYGQQVPIHFLTPPRKSARTLALENAADASTIPPVGLSSDAAAAVRDATSKESALKSEPPSTDARDAMAIVAKRMMERTKDGDSKDDGEDDEEDDSDDLSSDNGPKGTKTKVKKKPAAATPLKVKKPTRSTKRDVEVWPNPPSVSWEKSRLQVMCRTGKAGPGTTMRITFAEAGSAKKAWAKGQAWLKTMKAKYKAFFFLA